MLTRRDVVKGFVAGVGATLIGPYISKGAGKIRIGFMPLTDCATVVMAQELGLYKKYGVDVEVTKEASWPNVRDKLLNGELTAAHTLFSLPLSVYTGIGGPKGKVIPIVMVLSFNGQGIMLANKFKGKVGFGDIKNVKQAVQEIIAKEGECTFAMTFPGGTHDIWLRYWLGACGINPNKDVRVIPNPQPRMVANMKVGRMDGFCVGEPRNAVAVREGVGFTHLATQDVWKHHTEKVLAFNNEFFEKNKIQILKPVSPLAWLPIGLAVFQASDKAAVFSIAITSLWATLLNTAYSASSVPEDYKNVAKVFGFSTLRYLRYVVVPYTLPFMLTGLKISIGIAWMVIVAAEMLAGGTGIGFYMWDSWNALNLNNVISAILLIGVVGFILDYFFSYLQRRVQI